MVILQDDSGVYECKGVNGFGTMQAQIQLIITGLSQIELNMKVQAQRMQLFHVDELLCVSAILQNHPLDSSAIEFKYFLI